MARDMNIELKELGIKCVSLYPGVVRTERMKGILDSGEWKSRTRLDTPAIFVESPQLTGKVISQMYLNNDHILEDIAGKVSITAELAKKYNIKDPISNITPPSIRSIKFLLPSIVLGKLKFENQKQREFIENLIIKLSPDILLPMKLMEGGAPNQ